MDLRTTKLMTIDKALHHRDDVDRLYVSIKERGRELASIKDSVNALIKRLKKAGGGRMITAIRKNTDNTHFSRTKITRE